MTKTTTYKGHNLIVLCKAADDKYPFQFGVAKAKREARRAGIPWRTARKQFIAANSIP